MLSKAANVTVTTAKSSKQTFFNAILPKTVFKNIMALVAGEFCQFKGILSLNRQTR
jgi:hypothetical protein